MAFFNRFSPLDGVTAPEPALITTTLIEQEINRVIRIMLHNNEPVFFHSVLAKANKDKFFKDLLKNTAKHDLATLNEKVCTAITKLLIERYSPEEDISYFHKYLQGRYDDPNAQKSIGYVRFRMKEGKTDEQYLQEQIDQISRLEQDGERKFTDEMNLALEQSRLANLANEQTKQKERIAQLKSLEGELDHKFLFDSPDESDYLAIVQALDNYHDKIGQDKLFDEPDAIVLDDLSKSKIILATCNIIKGNLDRIRSAFDYFSEHLVHISQLCKDKTSAVYFTGNNMLVHKRDMSSDFYNFHVFDKLVPIEVRGDGNCLWNSISVQLFGDYSMMESLRLLTAHTLLAEQRFERYIVDQKSDLTFDQLIGSALELQVWGDEMHVMALSLALDRPVYSYGSLKPLIGDHYSSYDELKLQYESEDLINHYKYIADRTYEDRTPLLLYYNGHNHYSAVLTSGLDVRPLIPKTQLLEPIRGHSSETKMEVTMVKVLKNSVTADNVNTSRNGSDPIEQVNGRTTSQSSRQITDCAGSMDFKHSESRTEKHQVKWKEGEKVEWNEQGAKPKSSIVKSDIRFANINDDKMEEKIKGFIHDEYVQAKRTIIDLKCENQLLKEENLRLKNEVIELRTRLGDRSQATGNLDEQGDQLSSGVGRGRPTKSLYSDVAKL